MINEALVEQASLDWLNALDYGVLSGLTIAPGESAAERVDYKQVFLFDRLQTKLQALNPEKLAGYHQFHAVNKAVATTVEASRATGDRRAGVIWHTQGSGKSLSMVFYAGKIVQHPAMENPTIVVLIDQRSRRPTLRHILFLQGTPAPNPGSGGRFDIQLPQIPP